MKILTDFEIAGIGQELAAANNVSDIDFARAIEAKLMERIGEPVAFINCNSQRLEWAMNTRFTTPRSVELPPIPLFAIKGVE